MANAAGTGGPAPRWLALRLLGGDTELNAGIVRYLGFSLAQHPDVAEILARARRLLAEGGVTQEALHDEVVRSLVRTAETVCIGAVRCTPTMVRTWSAQAVPSFTRQTGQECATCHIGSFGPQLTPYGIRFKINGYTDTDGKEGKIPLSAMMVVNATRTKQLTNFRVSGKEDAIKITPPIDLTLEYGVDFIDDDELVEITPK